jgi:hypothetical protein
LDVLAEMDAGISWRRFMVLTIGLPDHASFWREFKAEEYAKQERESKLAEMRSDARERVGLSRTKRPWRHKVNR